MSYECNKNMLLCSSKSDDREFWFSLWHSLIKQLKYTAMQVIIPVKDKVSDKMLVADGFHTTDIMCMYELETGKMEWLDAAELCQYTGNITDELKSRGVSSIITNEMSFMALGLFRDGGFTVWKSKGNDLVNNLELFKQGSLDLFSPNTAFKSSCSGSCNSCETTCEN